MNFGKSLEVCVTKKYFDFNGRASRSELWWFYLFIFVVSIITSLFPPIYFLFALGTIIPSYAVGSRRLHDIGYSGWLQLLYLTVIGIIPLIIWFATEGTKKNNPHGKPIKIKK